MASFLHIREHWTESLGGGVTSGIVLSELPRGDSPVVCPMRCVNFVLDGIEQYEINGRVVTVRAGEFILVEAGTTARVKLPLHQVTRGICVYLPDPPGENSASPLGDVFKLTNADGDLSRRLRRVTTDLAENPKQGPEIAEGVVQETARGLEQLTAQLAPKLLRIEAARPVTRRDLLQKMEVARSHLHAHPDRTITIAELARVTAMSPFHLARTFRAVFQAAPADYHRRLRIELAELEVQRQDLPLGEIALRYGFSEASSFSRAYRKIHGCSPRSGPR
jgi:AraC-like DNA-binding protein